MQHISNITNLQDFQAQNASRKQLQSATETSNQWQQSSTANLHDTANADCVWLTFGKLFNGFATTNGELPNELWVEELAQLQPRDIQKGIEAVKRSGSDFAPSLPKFLKLCDPVIAEDVYRHERETQKLLERRRGTPASTPEVRRAEMAKIRAQLTTFKPREESNDS